MIAPEIPENERERLEQLHELGLVDTDPEPRFDRITRLARRIFDVPVALVSLVDADRQFFKSHPGLDVSETPREISICGYAILGDDVFYVPDTSRDDRFSGNPLTTGESGVRFYAGCPISGPGGATVGTLCIVDFAPRVLTEADTQSLRDLAGIVEKELDSARIATVDALTGISNRIGFEAAAQTLLRICRRRRLGATLIVLNLDDFRSVNDRLGHHAGDALLVELVELLRTTLGEDAVFGRIGGDEFSVILCEVAGEATAERRIEEAIARRNRRSGEFAPMRVSMGSVRYEPDSRDSLDLLMCRADAAMLEAKRAARRISPR